MTEQVYYIPNKISAISDLSLILEKVVPTMGVSEKVLFHINLVLDELITNIISYGYKDSNFHWIEIMLKEKDDFLLIMIKDDGVPFDPLERTAQVSITQSLDSRPVGGLGIHFAKQFSQKMDYERRETFNMTYLYFAK